MPEDNTVPNGDPTNKGDENKDQNQEAAFQRIQEKNTKLEAKVAELEGGKIKKEAPKVSDENGSDIRSIVKSEMESQSNASKKVSDIMTKFPSLNTDENKVRIAEYLKDETRKNVPIDEVVAGAIGIDALISFGAKLGSDAVEQANESKVGGGDVSQKTKSVEEKRSQSYNDSLPDFAK